MWRANFSRPKQTLVASIKYRTIQFLWHRILPLHMRACECRLSDFPNPVSQCDKMWQTQSHKHHQHRANQFFFFGNVTIETISCQTLNMLAPTWTLLHTYNRHDHDHDHDHDDDDVFRRCRRKWSMKSFTLPAPSFDDDDDDDNDDHHHHHHHHHLTMIIITLKFATRSEASLQLPQVWGPVEKNPGI